MNRAAQLMVFVVAFALAFGMLGGLGWFGWVGVQPDPGATGIEDTVEDQDSIGAAEGGPDDFSLVAGIMDTLNALRMITGQAGSMLVNLGVPAPIANPIQMIISLTVLLGLIQVIRGGYWR